MVYSIWLSLENRQCDLRKLEHTINAQATVHLTHISAHDGWNESERWCHLVKMSHRNQGWKKISLNLWIDIVIHRLYRCWWFKEMKCSFSYCSQVMHENFKPFIKAIKMYKENTFFFPKYYSGRVKGWINDFVCEQHHVVLILRFKPILQFFSLYTNKRFCVRHRLVMVRLIGHWVS